MSRAEAKAELNQILAAQLHRATPIDFVLPEDDEQAVRDGFDRAMKAPIKRLPDVPQPKRDDYYEAPDLRWFAWLLVALALTFLSFVMGFLAQRFLF
jgi:hypothetical protein